jgi:hypothetical protein
LLAAFLLLPTIAEANFQPSSLPILAKRTSTQLTNGQVREADCVVHSDGVVITRRMGPVQWTESRAISFQAHPSSSIDEIMADPLKTQTGSPADLSYHFVAYRKGQYQSILDEVVISRFDGKSGVTQEREGLTAGTLKSVLNSICPF